MAISTDTVKRNTEIVALHKKGWTIAKLAKKFDITGDSMYRLLRSLGRDALANEPKSKDTAHSAPKSAKRLKKAA